MQPVGLFARPAEQVELRDADVDGLRFDLRLAEGETLRAGRDQVEPHVEERGKSQLAGAPQFERDLLERRVLMLERGEAGLTRAPHQVAKSRIVGQPAPQYQCVGEVPDQALEFDQTARGDRRADHHVVLRAVAREHGDERRQERHVQRRVMRARQVPDPIEEVQLQDVAPTCPSERRGSGAGPVTRQVEHGQGRKFLPPVLELRGQFALRHRVPLPDRVVAVLHRERREGARAPGGEVGIQLRQLAERDVARLLIADDVMRHDEHEPLIAGEPHQGTAQQLFPREVEVLARRVHHDPPRLVVAARSGHRAQVPHGHRNRLRRRHHLARPGWRVDEPGAERLVPHDERVERPLPRREVEVAAHAQHPRHVVRDDIRDGVLKFVQQLLSRSERDLGARGARQDLLRD